jgi:hypothetical protein
MLLLEAAKRIHTKNIFEIDNYIFFNREIDNYIEQKL